MGRAELSTYMLSPDIGVALSIHSARSRCLVSDRNALVWLWDVAKSGVNPVPAIIINNTFAAAGPGAAGTALGNIDSARSVVGHGRGCDGDNEVADEQGQ
jgi:hypothetical protein